MGGIGLLNNELYIGRQVWNRQTYVKDPATGKRVSRPNPESDWTITEVPALRIIPQDLWEAVKARQGGLALHKPTDKPWDRRRPRYLFSILMVCGCCGGGMSMVNKTSYGCSAARNKGASVCTNKRLIKREELEERVLTALTTHLMQTEAIAQFCDAYVAERNRLATTSEQSKASLERALHKLQKEKAALISSIKTGVPGEFLKEDRGGPRFSTSLPPR
ncbi:recombinase family protein [Donghicola tyrosinivorans]|uniref:Recombinase-like zinc beta ribbon protein n=1 Tax=Donghicola tyrosinivorans TaxID=1652492 RepID=A0A2T0W608_9RHOB|nr:recombinase family protein [Donghicola tyrosinivorans]PRY82147.1 recombinase-like zinc beta ribbon protein [Donghicola tyrosinivorans]